MSTKSAKMYYQGTGSDKEAVARVFMCAGNGKFTINRTRDLDGYFARETSKMTIMEPLNAINMIDKFDFIINVNGGGNSGQADAVRLAIARALVAYCPEFKSTLKSLGYLTRDKRKVERKKFGLRKARKRKQYSKR